MYEGDQNVPIEQPPSPISFPTPENLDRPQSPRRLRWIVLTIVVMAAVVGGVYCIVQLSGQETESETSTPLAKTETPLERYERQAIERYDLVYDDLRSGDADKAIQTYQKLIDQAADDITRATLCLEIASALYQQRGQYGNKYDQDILTYAYQSDKLAPSLQAISDMIMYEREFGDLQKVAEYEQLLQERINNGPGVEDHPGN